MTTRSRSSLEKGEVCIMWRYSSWLLTAFQMFRESQWMTMVSELMRVVLQGESVRWSSSPSQSSWLSWRSLSPSSSASELSRNMKGLSSLDLVESKRLDNEIECLVFIMMTHQICITQNQEPWCNCCKRCFQCSISFIREFKIPIPVKKTNLDISKCFIYEAVMKDFLAKTWSNYEVLFGKNIKQLWSNLWIFSRN